MAWAALICQPFAFALIVWLLLRHLRARDTELATTTQALIATLAAERDARRDEIQMLLQRIQAPEQAVIQHAQRDVTVPDGSALTDSEAAQKDEQVRLRALLEEAERLEAEEREQLAAMGVVSG